MTGPAPVPAKEILFHVGLPKTGTTTIQNFMVEASATAQDAAWSFPFDRDAYRPGQGARTVAPQVDALAYFYGITRKLDVMPQVDWADTIDRFLCDPHRRHLVISHESQANAASRMNRAVVADLAARTNLRFLAYIREPVAWLTSMNAQSVYAGDAGPFGQPSALVARYVDQGYVGMLSPFAAYGRLDLRNYDQHRKAGTLLQDFLTGISATDLIPSVKTHASTNTKKSGRDTVLILWALAQVVTQPRAFSAFRRKIVIRLETADTSERAILPAGTIAAIHDRWAEDRAVLARDHGLSIPDPAPSETGPDHLSVSPDMAQRVRDSAGPRLDPDDRAILDKALRIAVTGYANPYGLHKRPSYPQPKGQPNMPEETGSIDPQLVNAVARTFWMAGYKVENPEATPEAIQNAWRAASVDYRKVARIALRRLAAQGVTVSGQIAGTAQDAQDD